MDSDTRLKRMRFRAWHRGTKEADLLVGGFFDAHAAGWDDAGCAWFEELLEEQDVDIMAWAMARDEPPARLADANMTALMTLSYISIAR